MKGYARSLFREQLLFWQDILLRIIECTIEYGIGRLGFVYVIIATSLILTEAYVFFQVVLPEMTSPNDRPLLHKFIGSWLLFNVLFNYVMCIITKPLSTLNIPPETLEYHHSENPRYCSRCKKIKPPFAHHCRICKKCILKMDHHCPWVANCVGYNNYRYFFLFIFWLWIGSLYAQIIMLQHMGWLVFPQYISQPRFTKIRVSQGIDGFANMLALLMPLGSLIAVSLLLFWHIFLVLTAQTTIDAHKFHADRKHARKMGMKWINIYDMGWRNNFQEVFDVKGKKLWWVRWMLPSTKRKLGNGYVFQKIEDYTELEMQNDGKQLVHWV